jgi:hypothetical protein
MATFRCFTLDPVSNPSQCMSCVSLDLSSVCTCAACIVCRIGIVRCIVELVISRVYGIEVDRFCFIQGSRSRIRASDVGALSLCRILSLGD